MKKYTPKEIESKWQDVWADTKIYEVTEDPAKDKIYCTPMLPYPSGAGLHVGHVRNYSISDALARFYRQRGYNSMTNIGWDSFGLPAENYAIKTGTPPAESTAANIANFTNQAKRLGLSFDWSRELNTSEPEYYKWTQWLFLQFFNDKLAYQAENLQWWCTKCKTVLANEQVENGKCWRHDGADDPLVEKRRTTQWFFKITEYADPLLEELENIDWPESITTQQRNWIGRSNGAEVTFDIDGTTDSIDIFTTRPDTIFGATFMVLAPENELLDTIVGDDQKDDVQSYIQDSVKKTDVERMDEGKTKSGVFTGAYAINPANNEKIPIWVSDFVLGGYGTGAIMAVPAHDQRDFEFAQKFDLPITQVFMESGDDPVNPPQEGFEMVERETVVIHLKDLSSGKYALLNWHGTLEGITTAVMGGVDDGETIEHAALKEIAEETGLSEGVRVVRTARWRSAATYCASHKKENRKSLSTAVYAEVDDLTKQAIVDDYESKTHSLVWVEADEVENQLTPVNQKQIWQYLQEDKALIGEGELINSGSYSGLRTSVARDQIVADLAKNKVAKEKVNYKMRDWLISRQRYWGAPIPIIHCQKCGAVPVPDKDLPVVLPEIDDYLPSGDGMGVLGKAEDWVNVSCPSCSGPAKRETDTLDGYVCSSWYLFRYCDPHNDEMAWDPEKVNYWFPMDFYLGGDHAVAHLLYFRFWAHYFAEKGLIDADKKEPVKTLVYNGYINAADGRKMSKSLGNVVDPLDIIESGYGADALRMYELFVGPYDQDVAWNPNGVPGTYRFLQRVWTLVQELVETTQADEKPDPETSLMLTSVVHKTIRKVTNDIERHRFNTAIAALMECVNAMNKLKAELPMSSAHDQWRESLGQLCQMLAPFSPHIAEEMWSQMGFTESIHLGGWPLWNEEYVAEDVITIVVQVNGKVRANLSVQAGTNEDEITALAEADSNVQKFVADGAIVKRIYVPNKLVNFVVK